jgi:hypothetical protein
MGEGFLMVMAKEKTLGISGLSERISFETQ